jgi:hypothetical protein
MVSGLYGAFQNGRSGADGRFSCCYNVFALWWFPRQHVISISSNGGTAMNFVVEGMADDKTEDFIYTISLAQVARVNQLAKL